MGLTEKKFKELVEIAASDIDALTHKELAQLRRSVRGGSGLTAAVVAEQKKRGLLVENWKGHGWPPEKLKRIKDYDVYFQSPTGWNYRVIKDFVEIDGKREYFFNIYEVYYDKQVGCRGGRACTCPIKAITSEPVLLQGYSLEDLRAHYDLMERAFNKPVLDYRRVVELFDDETIKNLKDDSNQ